MKMENKRCFEISKQKTISLRIFFLKAELKSSYIIKKIKALANSKLRKMVGIPGFYKCF